ncbi:RHE_PE00001 family protein [Neorhizobium sp. JUb45]|uniref:RHE_PE00001 family protein n=1 Tax=unclassified Neorhizobium TaxID=2629175 RepID=UPI00104E6078|nr:RHE_PE00001 family protein [Neorhizobium sp. JUb45]TCR03102.1 DNA binding protein with HTH domain [Neorhizobium sp. JUb45]
MRYEFAMLPFQDFLQPATAASAALARLDERVMRSQHGDGWLARSHFFDACASLWVDGELVHMEDLVLHDAGMGVRKPTHELTIAQDVLRSRRRILANPPGWALSMDGVRRLRRSGDGPETDLEIKSVSTPPDMMPMEGDEDPLGAELAAIDVILARSEALLAAAKGTALLRDTAERDALVYEPDWNEDERLAEWQRALKDSDGLPAVVRAAVVLDAWNVLQVLQHVPWLGRLLAAAILHEAGLTAGYLLPISVGLKQVQRQKRTHRDRDVRLIAMIEAMREAAESGLKEHDRLLLARQQMEHRLAGRRSSSKLPQLIDLILSNPIVSTGMIADALSVTPQGALKIAGELNLRELTGRGRFRAWGVL